MAKIIIEGCDRVGKSTLINGIINRLGYHLRVHFDRPRELEAYRNEPLPLKTYQVESFKNLLRLLSANVDVICDRSHLGEVVYAPLYRGYSGNYVFELEDAFIAAGSRFHKQTKLVLLVTDNFSIIQDDGNSFDFSMIESEQDQFMRALKRSRITNKQIVNVHDGNGSFKAPAAILQEVL